MVLLKRPFRPSRLFLAAALETGHPCQQDQTASVHGSAETTPSAGGSVPSSAPRPATQNRNFSSGSERGWAFGSTPQPHPKVSQNSKIWQRFARGSTKSPAAPPMPGVSPSQRLPAGRCWIGEQYQCVSGGACIDASAVEGRHLAGVVVDPPSWGYRPAGRAAERGIRVDNIRFRASVVVGFTAVWLDRGLGRGTRRRRVRLLRRGRRSIGGWGYRGRGSGWARVGN